MFSVGDTVVYGTQGVCRITEKTEKKFGSAKKEYFVLSPAADSGSTLYVPCDSEVLLAKMRRLISRSELDALIRDAAQGGTEWIQNDAQRREYCDAVLKSGDREKLLRLIVMLYRRREELKELKKHFHNSDAAYLKAAERLLHDEFAYVLGISADDVPEYIRSTLSQCAEPPEGSQSHKQRKTHPDN